MGCSSASTLFMLTLLLGMVKEDGTTAASFPGKGKPDWEGVEKLLRNISGSRHPGKTNVKYYGENVFKPTSKSFMQYLEKTSIMLVKLITQLQQYTVTFFKIFETK